MLKGTVVVPEGAVKGKQITGQALAGATVNIIDPKTGNIIATTTTDAEGKYNVEVPAGGPYIVQAVKGNIKVLDVSPVIKEGETKDLGTTDAASTAQALIFQALVEKGSDPAQIDLEGILNLSGFSQLVGQIEAVLEAGNDPTANPQINNLVENIVSTKPTISGGGGGGTPTPDITPPQITALSYAGINGIKDNDGVWTLDINGTTQPAKLNTGSITVSEACTLTVKKINEKDVTGWGFKTPFLKAGKNDGSLNLLFNQEVNFPILNAQANENKVIGIEAELRDAAGNTTVVQINVELGLPVFNGNVSGVLTTDASGNVTGTITGDYTLSIDGQVTEYVSNRATFNGTVSGDIEGNITAEINANGIDTMAGEITETGATVMVRIIGIFPQSGIAGDFEGEIISGPKPTYVDKMGIMTEGNATTVEVGNTLNMQVEVTPSEASDEVLWSVWSGNGQDWGQASIDEKTGVLTGESPGKVVVIAKALDGSLKDATITIIIVDEPPQITALSFAGVDGTKDASGDWTIDISGVYR